MTVPLTAAALLKLMKNRRSIRRYTPEPVPPATIARLIEAATWAPSAHNRQPWRFAVLTAPADKERLALAMGRQWRNDRAANGDDPAEIDRDVARSYARLTGAPAIIVVCISLEETDAGPNKRHRHYEWLMAAQSAAMAAQNLLLLAHAEGLGACWLCAPLFAPEAARAALELPAGWEPQGLITLGYPAELREKTRQPMAGKIKIVSD